ncbi:MAG: hypothetical protein HYW22_01075 [Candidatus Aenigmarchaeota archaeon]|nr:hypothetical protein [Candidatus Aenigmarchaeota archaeon]
MAIGFTAANIVNFLAFFGLTIATYTIFYFGKSMGSKNVSINLFMLALGINLIGLSHLFRIFFDTETPIILLATIAAGAFFMSMGMIWVFYEKGTEVSRMKRREEDINSIISTLKDKYYQQGLNEDDLKKAYSGLLNELAEIEVKLNSSKSKMDKS